ncbi:MAG: Flp pilus assembly complex ATPase component TadA [Oscillospiraceae bacterium]|jgi:stage III sporulation protein AA|nr:Flp pilus assembly complex ATPase component TadA [Oscillospiraceae bacterium]
MRKSYIEKAIPYLPLKIRSAFETMSIADKENITEIRLRVNRAVGVVQYGMEKYLGTNGGITTYPNIAVKVTLQDIEAVLKSVTEYSIHSFGKELQQGYITLEGGNRVGIAGTYQNETLKYVNAFNFRIAGEVRGASDDIFSQIKNFPKSILIAGKPSTGKTTILRDLCKKAGDIHRVSLIDERHEIAACYNGIPQNDIGMHTDVFEVGKAKGINLALRVMSPEIIVCDEIGLEDDITEIARSVNSGVKLIASIHAGSRDDVLANTEIKPIFNVFDYLVILREAGKIEEVIRLKQ